MDDWFSNLSIQEHLSSEAVQSLQTDGFVAIENLSSPASTKEMADGYDRVVLAAPAEDLRIGSTTIRVSGLVNRGPEFDELYILPAILEAACRVIQEPFLLSTLHARTLMPLAPAQRLHVDFAGDMQGWPMLGFIYMIDQFTTQNGATRFVARSQGIEALPEAVSPIPACGPAGSVILFNGSVWHGHGPNMTTSPRRSIQGAYIRRSAHSAANVPARILPQTLERIGPLAKYLLAI